MTDLTTKKHLKNLLRRLYPQARLSPHPLGVALKLPDKPLQLIACTGAVRKPFDVVFRTITWDRMWAAAVRLNATLSYAIVAELGTSAQVLPLGAIDARHPDWKTVETTQLYNEESGEHPYEEVVRVPLAVANTAAVPEHRLTEWELQSQCVAWLRQAHPDVVMWQTANEAARTRWRHFEQSGSLRGAPDLTCVCPDGRVLFIEMKTRVGVLSGAQVEVGRQIRANGSPYVVVRTRSEFEALFAAQWIEASGR